MGRRRVRAADSLVAEEDVLLSLDELFGHLLDPVEGDVPEPVVDRPGDWVPSSRYPFRPLTPEPSGP